MDKIVHVILFALNVLFWGWHYQISKRPANVLRAIFMRSAILMILLGIALEYVQLYFIPNRTFDSGDIVADIAGSVLAALWLLKS